MKPDMRECLGIFRVLFIKLIRKVLHGNDVECNNALIWKVLHGIDVEYDKVHDVKNSNFYE